MPTVHCGALVEFLSLQERRAFAPAAAGVAGGVGGEPWAPLYLKIDIEELRYTCVRAVALLRAQQRPKYVSWEMREFAEHKKFPVIDVELILLMQKAGYTQMKIVENRVRLRALQGERRKPLPRKTAASDSASGTENSGEEKKGGEEEKG